MLEKTLHILIENLKKQLYLLFLPLSIILLFQLFKFLKSFVKPQTTTDSAPEPNTKRPELTTELPNEIIRLSSVKSIPRKEFGVTDLDWLKTEHLFNFGNFRKENNEGFGYCRSFNIDRILPNEGYEPLKKQDYQIFYLILEGSLEYADHLENLVNLKSNSIALVTAGSEGIVHINRNGSPLNLTYLSLWFAPNQDNLEARFDYLKTLKFNTDGFTPLVSPLSKVKNGEEGSENIEFEPVDSLPDTIGINSDTYITHFQLSPDTSLVYEPNLQIDPNNPKKTRKLIIYGIYDNSKDGKYNEIIINYEYILETGGAALLLAKQGIKDKVEDVMLHNLSNNGFRGIIVDMA